MLQEENENLLEKVCLLPLGTLGYLNVAGAVGKSLLHHLQLRLAEKKHEEAEARARELERQVCNI